MKKEYKKTIKEFEHDYDRKTTRKLSDVKEFFTNKKDVEKALKKRNPVLYEVFIKEFFPIDLGLTVVNPGNIKKEYFHTKGHIHKAKTPEFYILIEGKGDLLIQKKGKPKVIHLKQGKIALIPEGYAHRLINTGRKQMKTLTIYHQKSRPNYKVKFKKTLSKK